MSTRRQTVRLGALSFRVLTEEGERLGGVSAGLERVVRVYLHAGAVDRPGWSFPRHLRGAAAGERELWVDVDEDLWLRLEDEARRQGVSVSQMVAQAILYYAAERDSGRLTERILEEEDLS